ncbi:cilia- and flagella- associated protein 210 [Pleuronectes platessa]|uniref:cilia- and flagella- associated protein 210 n=1 Tax=Pleuronectes platessa TaxID=8262 RepID=UPI00232A4AA2|nr:cilia- and flagella- associated protein 210 [Pleuronectes platessa]
MVDKLITEETSKMFQAPDLRQVTVLTKAEWQRIQNEVKQGERDKESMREAENQRKALHLKSKQMVKEWPDTIANQRQKKLEAKKIREQIEEEKRKQLDIEEAEYNDQQRKEAIVKAKTQLYYQTDQIKGLHSALLLTEVLKEREAQIELKKRIKSVSKDVEKEFINLAGTRKDEALREEEEKAAQRKLEKLAVAEELKNQMKKHELARERQERENKKEGEEILRLHELYLMEQRMEEERQEEQKRNLKQAQLEHVNKRDLMRAAEAQKQAAEEEQRKLFLSAKQKMMKLRKEKETELFREVQRQREGLMKKLTDQQQEQTVNEDQRIAKAVAEQEARREQQLREEEEKRAAGSRSIAEHRELMRQETEQRDKEEQQRSRDMQVAKKEADSIFCEKEKAKAQRIREDLKKIQDCNSKRMAAKAARQQQLRREEEEFEARTRALLAEEEKQFLIYSHEVIHAAAEAQRDVFPLCKAASEGIGGGLGPVFGGVRPSYMVQDRSGAQMPNYSSGATQNIKELHETVDIQEAKKRLGFMWED